MAEDYLCVYTTAGPFDVIPASAKMIVGTYQVDGENHGKKVFRRMEDLQRRFLPDVVCFFWDDRDGEAASGWWFGSEVGGGQTWARNPVTTDAPPLKGWRCPSDGPVQDHVVCRKPAKPPNPRVAWLRPKVVKEEHIVKEEQASGGVATPNGVEVAVKTEGDGTAEHPLPVEKRPLPPGFSLWVYSPSNGADICMRRLPELEAPRNGFWMTPGEVFQVCHERRGPDGILYLKLADGRGWVFDYKPGVGLMCAPKEPELEPAAKRPCTKEELQEKEEKDVAMVSRVSSDTEEALKAAKSAREAGRGGAGDEALVEAMCRLLHARAMTLERALASLVGSRALAANVGPVSFEDEETILSDGLHALLGCVREELQAWTPSPQPPPQGADEQAWAPPPQQLPPGVGGQGAAAGAAGRPLLACKEEEEPEAPAPGSPIRPPFAAPARATPSQAPPAPARVAPSQAPPPARGGREGLQRWAERVHSLAGGDTQLLQRCREFVRGRILEGHAAGQLEEIDWDEEPLPSLDYL